MSRWNQQACCFPEIFRAHQGALLWFNNIAGSLTLFWTGKQKSKHIWGVKGSYNINLPCQATPQELGPSFNYSVFGGQNLLTNSFGIWINMFCPSKNIHTPSDSRLLNKIGRAHHFSFVPTNCLVQDLWEKETHGLASKALKVSGWISAALCGQCSSMTPLKRAR